MAAPPPGNIVSRFCLMIAAQPREMPKVAELYGSVRRPTSGRNSDGRFWIMHRGFSFAFNNICRHTDNACHYCPPSVGSAKELSCNRYTGRARTNVLQAQAGEILTTLFPGRHKRICQENEQNVLFTTCSANKQMGRNDKCVAFWKDSQRYGKNLVITKILSLYFCSLGSKQ